MSEHNDDFVQRQPQPVELSTKELQTKKVQSHKKKHPARVQVSKRPKDSVKVEPHKIHTHFTWALILTILCFFVIGPCWALYKTYELRRLIKQQEIDEARRLSHKISTVLLVSSMIGGFLWMSFLFCSVGLVVTGIMLRKKFI